MSAIYLPKNAFSKIWTWASQHGVPTVAYFAIFGLGVYMVVVQFPKQREEIQGSYDRFQDRQDAQLKDMAQYFRNERSEDRKSIDKVADKLDKFAESVDRLASQVQRQNDRQAWSIPEVGKAP